MYIKVAGAKGHEYVYVCRNYRENGKIKIKCEHVEKLGRLKVTVSYCGSRVFSF